MKVVALIPAYNEQERIGTTVHTLAELTSLDEIVVINDGSTDHTRQVVEEAQRRLPQLHLVNLGQNHGKGGALNQGWALREADVYLLLDADLGRTARHAQLLLEPVLSGEVQMTIGCFSTGQSSGKMGFGMVRRLAAWGIWLLTGTWVKSPLSGQRAVAAQVLHTLGGFSPGFGVEVGLTVGALHHRFQIREVPVPMQHRAYGRGWLGFKHRGRQLVHVLSALWRCWRKGWHR